MVSRGVWLVPDTAFNNIRQYMSYKIAWCWVRLPSEAIRSGRETSPKTQVGRSYVTSNADETEINDHVVCDDTSRTLTPLGALDRSRVACDLERVEVLLKLNGPAVADRPDMGDLCFAFLSLSVKPEIIVAESHNSLTAVASFNPITSSALNRVSL